VSSIPRILVHYEWQDTFHFIEFTTSDVVLL